MSKEREVSRSASASGAPEPAVAPVPELYKVSMRIPPFWPEEPEIWFAQVEGQFANSGITSDTTKFNHIIGSLDHQFSREIKDIIVSPPATNKYEKVKTELIKRLTASKEKKVKQLLMHEELGDRKPSQFLRHLQSLAGLDVPADFLQTIWTSRLPGNIQTVLAAQPDVPLDVLATLADRIQDIAPASSHVAAMSHSTHAATPGSSVDSMAKEIAELRKQVQTLTMQMSRSRPRSRNRQNSHRYRNRSSSTRSQSSYRKYPLCRYHWKFGDQAQKCSKPCDYSAKGNGNGNQ